MQLFPQRLELKFHSRTRADWLSEAGTIATAAARRLTLPPTPMDLLSVLPGFATKSYAHILPPLERGRITTVDLITLDTLEIAKRAHVPPADVRRLSAHIVEALHGDLGFERTQTDIASAGEDEPSSSINTQPASVRLGPATKLQTSRWDTISTLDPALDTLLGGGIPTGYVTEVTGERYMADGPCNSDRGTTD